MTPLPLCLLSLFLLSAQSQSEPPDPDRRAKDNQEVGNASGNLNPHQDSTNPAEVVPGEVGVERPNPPVEEPPNPVLEHSREGDHKDGKNVEHNRSFGDLLQALRNFWDWLWVSILPLAPIIPTAVIAFFSGLTYLLNRRLFYIANRPILRLRGVKANQLLRIHRGTPVRELERILDQGLYGSFETRNVGGSAAIIVKSYLYFLISESPHWISNPPWKINVANEKIRLGELKEFHLLHPQKISRDELYLLSSGALRVYVMGCVQYKDSNGVVRETSFCRWFNPDTRQLEYVDNKSYEYED